MSVCTGTLLLPVTYSGGVVKVVGTSEELDGFMTLCSHHLNVPPAHLTYKNEKVLIA
jgi:hypothetical protein